MRLRDVLAVFAKAVDVQLNCFPNKLHSLFFRVTDSYATWKIRHICTVRTVAFFKNYEVFHMVSRFLQTRLLPDTAESSCRHIDA